MTSRGRGVDAAELMARLAQDPEYQAGVAEKYRIAELHAEPLREAERPIVADLRAAGSDVNSVWDLVNTSEPYPEALPVLIAHLERGGYPDRTMESLGRAIAVKPAVAYWERLKKLWLGARNAGEEDGTAVALAAAATAAQLDDLIEFLSVEERSRSRIYFIRPILKLGGARGFECVEALRNDPTFGPESRARLRDLRPSRSS